MHTERDPRLSAIPDIHGHAKGEHKPYVEERPLPLTARMLFLWFYHACRRGYPRFLMVADHINYLTFEDPASVNLVRRALKLAQAGDLYGAAETANVDVGHAQVVSEGLRRGMRYSIGAEVDNDPRARPDAQNIVDAMRPDGLIRSVHFIPIDHPVHGANWNWAFDNPEFLSLYDHVGTEKTWDGYMAVLLDAIERLPGNIVGHFYVPANFGHWPDDATLERYEDQMLDAAGARGMAIEFNTRFLYRDTSDAEKQRYLDANRRLMRKAKERGLGIAVGSDAHSPRDQGGRFQTVLDILDELDINELVFPIAGRLARVALRYVKPAEPEPTPVPEPAALPVFPAVVAIAPDAAPGVDGTNDAPPVPIPAKPVRKARAGASSTRPKETSPDRHDDGPFEPPAASDPPDVPVASVDPVPGEAAAVAPAPAPARRPRTAKAKKPAAPPQPAPSQPAPALAPPAEAVKPAQKASPKPAASKPPAKAPATPAKALAKPTPKPTKPKAKTSAKAAAKKTGKAAPTKRAPAKRAPPKRVSARKAAAKKTGPKKPVRAAPKAPAKKTAAKKAARPVAKRAPVKKVPARKTVAKKTAPKKAAAKRR